RQDVLARRGGRADERRSARALDGVGELGRPRLGERRGQRRALVGEHARGVLRGVGRRGGQLAGVADHGGDDGAALVLGQVGPGGQRVQRRGAYALAIIRQLAEHDDGAHQITFASVWSLATSSSTEATLMPALRPAGASYVLTLMSGVAATPRSASETSAMGFFLAA